MLVADQHPRIRPLAAAIQHLSLPPSLLSLLIATLSGASLRSADHVEYASYLSRHLLPVLAHDDDESLIAGICSIAIQSPTLSGASNPDFFFAPPPECETHFFSITNQVENWGLSQCLCTRPSHNHPNELRLYPQGRNGQAILQSPFRSPDPRPRRPHGEQWFHKYLEACQSNISLHPHSASSACSAWCGLSAGWPSDAHVGAALAGRVQYRTHYNLMRCARICEVHISAGNQKQASN